MKMKKMISETPNAKSAFPSRRGFLIGTGLTIGSLAVPSTLLNAEQKATHQHVGAAGPQAKPFKFGQEPQRIRKSFYDLTDEEVRQLCAAVGYMRNGSRPDKPLSVESPLQWDQYAHAHAHHCTEGSIDEQVHWSWYFLPWHRAYLFFLERILADVLTKIFLVDGSKFALPYWDWTSHPEMPNTKDRADRGLGSPLFGYDLDPQQETMVSGTDTLLVGSRRFDNLALWDGYRTPTLAKPEMQPNYETNQSSKEHIAATRFYMGAENIATMLRLPFESFAGKSTISAATGQGLLEQDPHNNGHDWVGSRYGGNRDMGTLRYAAHDPIFFLHHANIDRIWSLYSYEQPDLAGPWGVKRYPFLDVDGTPVDVSVADVVRSMNTVRYASPASGNVPAIFAAAVPATPRPAPKVDSEVLVAKPATLKTAPITIDAELKPSINALVAQGAAPVTDPATAPISLLEITTGPVKFTGKFSIRVFANKPDANSETSTEDPHYLGRIRGLDSEARASSGSGALTHTFSILLGSGESKFHQLLKSGEPLKITLVPIGMSTTGGDFTVEIKEIKLKVVH